MELLAALAFFFILFAAIAGKSKITRGEFGDD